MARNQHYVPELILKKFTDSSGAFVWSFDKKPPRYAKDIILKRPIKKVATENHFYDFKVDSNFYTLDGSLTDIENRVAPILNEIENSLSIEFLSLQQRDLLSLFILIQHQRTKQSINLMNDLNKKIELELKAKGIPAKQIQMDKSFWLTFLKEIPKLKSFLSKKVWCLIESDDSFYCSDHPVVLQNTTADGDFYGNLGLDSYGIEIYIPLSPSLILALFCEKVFLEKGFNGKSLQRQKATKENILNLNSLQIKQSDRFIISNKNDFTVVQEILSNN